VHKNSYQAARKMGTRKNGSNDVIVYTVNSFILQRNLPNAQLIIYPDSNHGSQYQFPELFVEHVKLFLGELSIGR
jgi:pimeloyl-ACP methyl ester carboxylesterase